MSINSRLASGLAAVTMPDVTGFIGRSHSCPVTEHFVDRSVPAVHRTGATT